jgi:hypothetical protein
MFDRLRHEALSSRETDSNGSFDPQARKKIQRTAAGRLL